MRKLLLLALPAAIVAVAAALLLRIQPSGQAIVVRDGAGVRLHTARIYPRSFGGDRCSVATDGGRLLFDGSVIASTATADEIPLRVRFAYDAPASLPPSFPSGSICGALLVRVASAANEAMAHETVDALLADRRGAGERVAAAIAQQLQRDRFRADAVSARPDVPEGIERLRAVNGMAPARRAPPVIFVGLDGADWQLLDGYMHDGSMPVLARLVSSGSGGVLETDFPALSPLVWTTMMTGVGPLQHSILDFTRFNPYTRDKEPITSDERRVPAVWNMLTYAGKQASVFGMWATYAAEPVHGVNVSDRLFTFLYSDTAKPAGVVWPPSRQPWAEGVVADAERAVDAARMREYLPGLSDAEFSALSKSENPYADPPAALRRILVETEIYRRLSRGYLGQKLTLPDLTVVYIQGTDTIGHVFAPFAPPRQPEIAQADYDRYSGVPARYFREIDALLGEYAALADRAGAVLMIASDHGFYWREGRPTKVSSTAAATAAKWHRKEGIYLLHGGGIAAAPGHPLRGSVRQVCATLLSLTGMPAAAGAQPPLSGAPAASSAADYARFFTRAAAPPPPPAGHANAEEIAKLKALGYIGSGESSRSAAPGSDTKTAGAFNNEGLILRNEHQVDAALAAFDRALAVDPKYASAMWNESETLFDASRDLDRADRLLVAALQNGLGDAARFTITRAIAYQRSGRADRSLRLLESAVAAAPADAELRMFRGRYRMEAHDCSGALDDFRAVVNARPDDALAWASSGIAQLCTGDQAGARASFARAHQLDPSQPLP